VSLLQSKPAVGSWADRHDDGVGKIQASAAGSGVRLSINAACTPQTAMHSADSHALSHLDCAPADGFGDLHGLFFSGGREQLPAEAAIGAVLTVLVPVIMIVILFNFLIAAIFNAYAELRDGYTVIILAEKSIFRSLKVCASFFLAGQLSVVFEAE
jgi:hypothetical protein